MQPVKILSPNINYHQLTENDKYNNEMSTKVSIEEDVCLLPQSNQRNNHRRSYQQQSSTSVISSVNDFNRLKPPHKIPLSQINIKRVQRSIPQKLMLMARSFISMILPLPFLLVFVTIAVYRTAKTQLLDSCYYKNKRPQDDQEVPVPSELLSADETYYANYYGYISEKHQVVTEDGYILTMYRIYKKGSHPQGKNPVLIGHGLFQCSGAFVLNEERSLAFSLCEAGYDVWVGNNRSTGGLDHISLSHEDVEYWQWGLKELGIHDFPSMVDHVRQYSGFDKIAYIGHSQGNAQAFIGLSLRPDISEKLSCFIALAPAVFSGTLVNAFPLRLLINLGDWMYSMMFGSACFLPVMTVAQKWVEPRLFCFLAYSMFSYLFTWWDSHWLRRRKAKYFQYTPRPVSSQLIADWVAGWGRKGVCLYVGDPQIQQKTSEYKVPLCIFYGTADYLVNGERLVRTFKGYESHGLSSAQLSNHEHDTTSSNTNTLFPMLDLVHVERVDQYEHMDTIWGHDNHITTYPILLDNLAKAKWD